MSFDDCRSSVRKITISMLAALVALLGLAVFGAGPASAKPIPGAITGVTVTPTNPTVGSTIRTDITWCVPDGTQAGDTFTLTLPNQLGQPPAFAIKDGTGAVIANAAVTSTHPIVITFTLTAYAASHQHVCGTAFFTDKLNSSSFAGTTQVLTFTTGTGQQFTTTIHVPPTGTVNRTHALKTGSFTVPSDECRTTPHDCVQWSVQTPTGPSTSGTVDDTVQSPQIVDCPTLHVYIGAATGPGGQFQRQGLYTGPTTVTCSTTAVHVAYGAVPADKLLAVVFRVSLPAPDPSGGVTYRNTGATVHNVFSNGNTRDDTLKAAVTSASAGGNGGGTVPVPGVTITKDDSAGNAADTPQTVVLLPNGSTGLVYTITNTGTEPLDSVVVSDQVVANGTVTGLSCTFPGGSTGTTWAGPFAAGASFTCTAQLSGVVPGTVLHEDIGTVQAVGQFSGQQVSDHNPYYATTPTVSVGDFVWDDADYDGLQTAGEPGIAGVTLTLTGPSGQPVTDAYGNAVGPTTTDAHGGYTFANLPVLPAGQHYTVHVDASSPALAGYVATKALVGADRAIDSSTGSATSGDLTQDGQRDPTLDFGFVKPVTVGDFVWVDTNHDGVQGAGEPGIPGVRLTLTDAAGQPVTDLAGHRVGPTTTDASGHYLFADLPPGQYEVRVDNATVPAKYSPTVTGQGTRATDSSTGSATSVTLAGGGQDLTLDFGFYARPVSPVINHPKPKPHPKPPPRPHPPAPVQPPPSPPLAWTGVDAAQLLGLAATLMFAGGLTVAAGRRRG
jgi:hypothetical protein